jgi:hypothetical protein
MIMHLVYPVFGQIHREWLAEGVGENHLLVEEAKVGCHWLVLYEWEAGWTLFAPFRMGSLEDYEGAGQLSTASP